jgi:hypothetical protein
MNDQNVVSTGLIDELENLELQPQFKSQENNTNKDQNTELNQGNTVNNNQNNSSDNKDDLSQNTNQQVNQDNQQQNTNQDIPKYTLNEMFGDSFSSIEEVKSANIPNVLNEYKKLKSDIQSRDEKLNLYSQKLKEKFQPYKNDEQAQFISFWNETGIDDIKAFKLLKTKEFSEMSDKDVLIMNTMIENPTLIGNREKAEKMVDLKFKIGKYSPTKQIKTGEDEDGKDIFTDEVNKDELELNEMYVLGEAKKARENLSNLKLKIKSEVNNFDDKQLEGNLETFKNAWNQISPIIANKFNKLPIFGDTDEPIANFEVPQEIIKDIAGQIQNMAVNNQMPFDEKNGIESVKNLHANFLTILYGRFAKEMQRESYKKGKSDATEKIKKQYNLSGLEKPEYNQIVDDLPEGYSDKQSVIKELYDGM